ncbi:uncharacterized protein ARMOST_06564 [Armillaria ostoyae]|uniref:Uncharacterized protein n=1 Tax=Armillaria ostoyae TaxID=47428 RepID=A0A284R3D1_ARMOS|nr:uncharacterized protein ARMOST_06564 [Armillaria ostoyae]
MPKIAAFLRVKSGFLCSDRGKHILHSVFRALFLTLKERPNEMSQHFEVSFFRSENVSAPAVKRKRSIFHMNDHFSLRKTPGSFAAVTAIIESDGGGRGWLLRTRLRVNCSYKIAKTIIHILCSPELMVEAFEWYSLDCLDAKPMNR